jgi:hypothetical protein
MESKKLSLTYVITYYRLNMLTIEQSKIMDIYKLGDIPATGHGQVYFWGMSVS